MYNSKCESNLSSSLGDLEANAHAADPPKGTSDPLQLFSPPTHRVGVVQPNQPNAGDGPGQVEGQEGRDEPNGNKKDTENGHLQPFCQSER